MLQSYLACQEETNLRRLNNLAKVTVSNKDNSQDSNSGWLVSKANFLNHKASSFFLSLFKMLLVKTKFNTRVFSNYSQKLLQNVCVYQQWQLVTSFRHHQLVSANYPFRHSFHKYSLSTYYSQAFVLELTYLIILPAKKCRHIFSSQEACVCLIILSQDVLPSHLGRA